MTNFTPVPALAGGVLIGLSASLLWAANGRIAGISGIFGELLRPGGEGRSWRLAFLTGLVCGGAVLLLLLPESVVAHPDRSLVAVAMGGLAVGYGTRMGNGCTSGHGVCGIPRGSTRSLVATAVFIAAGMLTVTAVRVFAGGVL